MFIKSFGRHYHLMKSGAYLEKSQKLVKSSIKMSQIMLVHEKKPANYQVFLAES